MIIIKSGTVKWFNESKGFGFLSVDSGGADVFVHQSAVIENGQLQQGQTVEFEVVSGDKGDKAVNVKIISGAKSDKPDIDSSEIFKQFRKQSREKIKDIQRRERRLTT